MQRNPFEKLEKMGPDDFKGFISLRAVYNALSKYKDKGIFDEQGHRLEASEQEEVLRTLGSSREMAELISADDVGATTDVLDRQIIAAFREYESKPEKDLGQLFVKRPVNDFVFRTILYSALENYSPKKDHEGYDAAYIDVDDHDHELDMWGKLVHVSWKAWRSSRNEIVRTLPEQLGIAGKRTLQRIYAALLGLPANRNLMYTAANGNLFDLALTLTNLEYVILQMLLMNDPMTNEPRDTEMIYLVVPAILKATAERIVKPVMDTLALQTIAGNWNPTNLKIISSARLDKYTTTGWWLFAEKMGNQGPCVDAYLIGNEGPELFIKESDSRRISGAGPDELGSFRTDNLSWKGRLSRAVYWLTDNYWMTCFSEQGS